MWKISTQIFAVLLAFAVPPSLAAGKRNVDNAPAKFAALRWLGTVDSEKYEDSWTTAADFFQKSIAKDAWVTSIKKARAPFGKVVKRKLKTAAATTALPGAPDGKYFVLQYETTFENKQNAIETVTPMLGADGQWHVSGYFIK